MPPSSFLKPLNYDRIVNKDHIQLSLRHLYHGERFICDEVSASVEVKDVSDIQLGGQLLQWLC